MKIWSLEVLRFWAALAVVHLHAVARAVETTGSPGVFGDAAAVAGRAGVDVFFVLSGVVITLSGRSLAPGAFVVKRVRRILPIYLVMAAPWIVLWAMAGSVDYRQLAATVTLWPVYDQLVPPLLGVGWSLCFEALFYAAFALVLWRPQALPVLLIGFVVALGWRSGPALQFLGNPIILEFLAGVLLAFAPKWRPAIAGIPIGLGLLVLGAVLNWPPSGGALEFLRGDEGWLRVATLGLPAVMIVAGALQLSARPGVLTYLGGASYALYLAHPLALFVLALVLRATNADLPPDLIILAGVAVSLLFGWRVHELIEKPILAALSRKRAPVPA